MIIELKQPEDLIPHGIQQVLDSMIEQAESQPLCFILNEYAHYVLAEMGGYYKDHIIWDRVEQRYYYKDIPVYRYTEHTALYVFKLAENEIDAIEAFL